MKHKPTPEQQAAIDAPLGEILVSASAGTGKTRVMTERLIQRILSEEVDIGEVLVLTFTDAASHEMRRRISLLLDEAIEKHPEKRDLLLAQRRRLQQAQISTLHSFCLRVIRDFRHLLEEDGELLVEADFHTISPEQATETLELALERVMDETYRTMVEEESFGGATKEGIWLLNDTLGSGSNDSRLRDSLISTYHKLQAYPDFEKLVLAAVEKAEAIAEDLWTPTSLLWITEELRPEIEATRSFLSELRNMLPGIQFYAYDSTKRTKRDRENKAKDMIAKANVQVSLDACEDILNHYDRLVGLMEGTVTFDPVRDSWDAWRERVNRAIEADAGVAIRVHKSAPERSAFVRLYRFAPRRLITRFINAEKGRVVLFRRPQAEIQGELRTMLPAIQSFAHLLLALRSRYQAEKRRLGGIDFSDFEHYAHQILKQEEAASFYQQRYREIYIDEYQDTSEIQEAILANLGKDKTFRVGDVKQSIYRFRAAEPRLFLERLERYQRSDEGELFSLTTNFRSEPGILEWVNELFTILMQTEVTEIEYRGLHEFTPGRQATEIGPRMDLTILKNERDSGFSTPEQDEMQDQQVLEDVRALIEEGVTPSDICIMARSHSTLRRFASLLQVMAIPYSYKAEKSDDELPIQQRRLETLIMVLDNPRQDQPLAAVLLSSFVPEPFVERELLELSLLSEGRRMKFHEIILDLELEGIEPSLKQKLRLFRLWLHELRRPLGAGALQERYAEIFEDSDFYAVCALSSNTREQMLPEQFLSYLEEHTELSDFHSLAKRLQGKSLDLGLPQTGDPQLLQLMTYHGSKGLEFPYVFLLDFQRDLFRSGPDSPLNYDRDLGFTINYRDPNRPIQRLSIFDQLLRSKLRRSDLSEEVRLLYVAMTRAEKKILTYARATPNSLLDYHQERMNQERDKEYIDIPCVEYEKQFQLLDIRDATSLFDLLLAGLELEALEQVVDALEETEFRQASPHLRVRSFSMEEFSQPVMQVAEYVPSGPLLESRRVSLPESLVIEGIKEKRYFLTNQEGEVDSDFAVLFEEEARAKDQEMLELKYSVSELLRRPEEHLESEEWAIWQSINRQQSSLEDVHLRRVEGKLRGPERGSAIHEVIRYLDWSVLREAYEDDEGQRAYEEQLQHMLDAQMIEPIVYETAISLGQKLMGLVGSEVGAKLARYVCLQEQPFTLSLPAEELYPGMGGEVQVQGVLDLAWFEEEKAGLLDFKTDYIHGSYDTAALTLKERYGRQMDFYQRAIEMSGLTPKVSNRFIFLVDRGELFRV